MPQERRESLEDSPFNDSQLFQEVEIPPHPLQPHKHDEDEDCVNQHFAAMGTQNNNLEEKEEPEGPTLEFRTLNPEINWSLDESPGLLDYSKWTLRFDNWGVELDYLRYYHMELAFFLPVAAVVIAIMMIVRMVDTTERISIYYWSLSIFLIVALMIFALLALLATYCIRAETVDAQQFASRRQEYLMGTLCFLSVVEAFIYYWTTATCLRSGHLIGKETHEGLQEQCVDVLPPILLWMVMLLALLGRPRCVISIPPKFLVMIVFPLGRIQYTTDTTAIFVIKYIALFLTCVVSSALSAWNEISQRQHFMESVRLYSETVAIRKRQKALDMRLLKLVPPQLYDRLVDEVGMLDVSQNACVIVCQVDEFPNWCSRLMPHIAAVTIGDLLSAVDQIAKKCHVERIKNLGDMIVVSSNLLGKCSNPVDRICLFAYELQLMVSSFNAASTAPIPLLSAVHSGHLIGAVVGTTHVRYDCFGEAMTECIKLIPFCEPYETLISQQAYRSLQLPNLIIVELREFPKSSPHADNDKKTGENGFFIFQGRVPLNIPMPPNEEACDPRMIKEESLLQSQEIKLSPHTTSLRTRMQRGRSASISIERVAHVLNDIVEGTELKVECLELRFVSPTMEDEYFHKWQHPQMSCVPSAVIYLGFCLFLFVVMIQQQIPKAFLNAILLLLVGLVIMVTRDVILYFFPERKTLYKIVAMVLLFLGTVFTFAATIPAHTKSIILSNNHEYMIAIFIVIIPFTLHLHLIFSTQTLSFCVVCTLVPLYVGAAMVARPHVSESTLVEGSIMVLFAPLCFLYKAGLHRTLYRDQLRSEQLLKVSEVQSELRQALIDSTIPQQVLLLIEGTKMLDAKTGSPQLARSQIVSGNETVVLLLQFCELERVCNSATRTAALDPTGFLSLIDAILNQAEEAVKKWCKNLEIVRMAGDAIMLSAPNAAEQVLVAYVEGMSVILDLSDQGACFSAVLTIGPTFAVIGQGEFPTFDLLGPATYYARSIMAAMPCPNMVFLSEHLLAYHHLVVEVSAKTSTLGLPQQRQRGSFQSNSPGGSHSLGPVEETSSSATGMVGLADTSYHPGLSKIVLGQLQTWKIRGLGVARGHAVSIGNSGEKEATRQVVL